MLVLGLCWAPSYALLRQQELVTPILRVFTPFLGEFYTSNDSVALSLYVNTIYTVHIQTVIEGD